MDRSINENILGRSMIDDLNQLICETMLYCKLRDPDGNSKIRCHTFPMDVSAAQVSSTQLWLLSLQYPRDPGRGCQEPRTKIEEARQIGEGKKKTMESDRLI